MSPVPLPPLSATVQALTVNHSPTTAVPGAQATSAKGLAEDVPYAEAQGLAGATGEVLHSEF